MPHTRCYMLLFLSGGKIFLNFIVILFIYINNMCIFVENIKTKRYEKH